MRIAVYKDNLSTGRGADTAVRNFAAGIAERGYDVTLMEKTEFSARVLSPQSTSSECPFDIIVATGSNEIADMDAAGYFSCPVRAKTVLQLHLAPRGFFKWKHPFRNRRIRAAFDKPDAVQLLCSSYEEDFRRIAPRPRLFTIGNYTTLSPQPSDMHSRVSRVKTILYPAAALNKIKNQKLLLEAFAQVADGFPEWKLRLLGKDTTPYAAECRKMTDRLKISDRVEFSGFTDDLCGEYSCADFVAFPSVLEGFPLAILEAAKFGLAVLAQRNLPGVTDIVKESETGLIADASVPAYAEGLRLLMKDEALRTRLGEGARNYCETNYSRDVILDKWERLFASLFPAD